MKDLSRLQRYSPALTQAIYDGRVPMVRKLLANGADANHIQPATGPWGPAHWAQSGHLRDDRGERHQVLCLCASAHKPAHGFAFMRACLPQRAI